MDATVNFVGSSAGGSRTINHFVLTGGSKRGWTAWLAAAVDSRVTAVSPIVSDLLNMKKSFAHTNGLLMDSGRTLCHLMKNLAYLTGSIRRKEQH